MPHLCRGYNGLYEIVRTCVYTHTHAKRTEHELRNNFAYPFICTSYVRIDTDACRDEKKALYKNLD